MPRTTAKAKKRVTGVGIDHSHAKPRSVTTIIMRLPRTLRDQIDNVATTLGKTRTEFILDSVRARATEVLLDQRLFALDHERYAAFVRALESPPAPNEKLKKLLRSRAPWET